MPTSEAQKTKLHPARRRVAIQADAHGQVPDKIEVVKAGMWPEMSNKGMLYITPDDLQEMVDNFNAGVGCAGGLNQIPIDFSHADYAEAAGWITALQVIGDAVVATVEWSDSGQAAIEGKRFKFFSPSFYPKCLGEWYDPEDWSVTATNVLVGGALTNIPFFKDLTPITASNSQEDGRNTIYVDADAKGVSMPTLEEVRVKEASALTDEEKTLLVENSASLTADERVKFGLEAEKPEPAANVEADNKPVAGDTLTDDEKKVIADFRSGNKVLVDKDEHAKLTASVDKLTKESEETRREKVTASVDAAVAAGKIVADRKDTWVDLIMANASMQEELEALPENKIVAEVNGKDGGNTGSAVKQLEEKAQEIIKASATDGKEPMKYGDAMAQARRENTELRDAADDEMKETN